MKRAVAHLLHRLAHSIYNDDRHERIEIVDEWGISRCRVEILVDDSHGVDSEFEQLPSGWVVSLNEF